MKIAVSTSYFEELPGKVSEFMTTDLSAVDPETSILEVAELFSKSPLRQFPVIEEGHLIGIISRVDVLRALMKQSGGKH